MSELTDTATAPEAVLHAPAKLTRTLRVTGVRDDGYHLLDAEFVSLGIADRLEIRSGDGLELVTEPDGPPIEVPLDRTNLVVKALAAVGRTAHVRLHKHIPPGAGLGGGSADAAAILRWAGHVDDVALAATLGADVPFCLRGGRARVTGIGDQLEPLPYERIELTLLTPPLMCETAAVYAAWDRLGGPSGPGTNDLETAAVAVVPALATWRDQLARASGKRPRLAGSGSTWFVEGVYDCAGALHTETTDVIV